MRRSAMKVAAALLAAAAALALASAAVVELDQARFDDFVGEDGRVVLLEYYAPWCGHCQRFAEAYEEVAARLAELDNVVVARIDASKHRLLTQRFRVKGLPSFFLVRGDKKKVMLYAGPRTVDAMVSFVESNGAKNGKPIDVFVGPFHFYWKLVTRVSDAASEAQAWVEENPVSHTTLGVFAACVFTFILISFAVFIHFFTKPAAVARPHRD